MLLQISKETWKPTQKWKANTAREMWCLANACENRSDLIVETALLKSSKKELF